MTPDPRPARPRPPPASASALAAVLVLLGSLGGPLVAAARGGEGPVAPTACGLVRGRVEGGICVFKGIPYGADTALRRFRAPVPPASWTGVREAAAFGPAPAQGPEHRLGPYPQSVPGTVHSEDCLNLNVWTPAVGDGRRRPVMVYFHGGGYTGWSANSEGYDGGNLCRRGDVVLVTVNARLNGFGFLYLAGLPGGEAYPDSGGAGMLDLVLALRWVRDNIAAFGGDPGCVTIFGQSGGGAKCATLMAMPAAAGLFHRVITESGQQLTGRTRAHGTATASAVLAALGIGPGRLADIDRVPAAALVAAFKGQTFAPVVDGRTLDRDPFAPDASPVSAAVPMIIGNTHDETTLLIGSADPSTFGLGWAELPAKLRQHIASFIGAIPAERIVAEYRRMHPDYTPSQVFFAASTAARSWKGAVLESERRARQGGAATYVYELDWGTPVEGGRYGAPHGLDIPLCLDNIDRCVEFTGAGPGARRMAALMSASWIAFARTGNPDTPALPHWPRFDAGRRATMIFDLDPRVVDDPRSGERLLFGPVAYVQPGT